MPGNALGSDGTGTQSEHHMAHRSAPVYAPGYHRLARLGLSLFTLLLGSTLALPAMAQAPKPGNYYEDEHLYGFKVKTPKGWVTIPPAPDDGNLILKFDPANTKYIQLSPDEPLFLHTWLLKFDRRPEAAPEEGKYLRVDKDLDTWIKKRINGNGFKLEKEKDYKLSKIESTEYIYGAKKGQEQMKVYAMLYRLEPDVDVAYVGVGPGEKKKWSKWEKAFRSLAKSSFKKLKVERKAATKPAGGSLRDRKRAKLEDHVKTLGDEWQLLETPNYFVLTSNPDKRFNKELLERLEAIREIYEADYPLEKALIAREARAKLEREEGGEEPDPEATTAAPADPMEQSKTSVVRVCKDEATYLSYGGPPQSNGYWNWVDEELVVYDAKATRGRSATWGTLNHEAFHQYIFYFYGNISPHSWYNEGTGDFYGGYEWKHGKFKLTRYQKRVPDIKGALREKDFVPLKELVTWTQAQYYGGNEYNYAGWQNYAQGWSFIYFLRTGKKNVRGWDDSWSDILDKYMEVLGATGDKEAAVEQAFAGVDWQKMEELWLKYTES